MGVKTHLINNKMENNNIIDRVKSLMEFKPVEYGHLISEQPGVGAAKQFKLAGKGATELANLLKMSVDDVRNAVRIGTDVKAFEKAVRADLKAGVTGVVGPSAKLLSKQKTIQELLNSGKLTDTQIIQIIERNKKATADIVSKVKPKPVTPRGSNQPITPAQINSAAPDVITVLGSGWKTMDRAKSIKTLLAAGVGIAAIMYFLKNEDSPLPDCVINKLTENDLTSVGTSVTFKTTGVKGLDIQGGIILMDNGTCTTGNGKYKGTYSCSGDNISVKLGNNEYLIPSSLNSKPLPNNDNDNKKTPPNENTKKIQTMLVNKGYYIGNTGDGKGVDGYFGKKTTDAYNAFNSGESAEDFNQRVYKIGKTTIQQGGTQQGGTQQGVTQQGGTQQGGTQQGGTQQGGTQQGGTLEGEINIINPNDF